MPDLRNRSAKTYRDPVGNLVAANLDDEDALTNGDGDCLFVEAEGDVTMLCVGGSADVTVTLPVGWHPIRVSHIRATGTTATVFVGYT